MRTKFNIILFQIFLIVFLSSCRYFNTNLGKCSSSSIEYAKKKGTFLSEYIPGRIKINDSIQFTIKQVFAENQYGYYSHSDPSYTIKKDKSLIVVITEKKIDEVKGYSNTWIFSNLNWVNPGILSIKYNDSIPPDTIQIDILRRDINSTTGLAGNRDNEKIGYFKLVKKFDKNMN
jgi:hypothetical protein